MIREEGEAAALEVGVHGIHPELIKLLGRMKFRTSYGQNALKHSMEVSQLAGLLAGEIGLDVRVAKEPVFYMILENLLIMMWKAPTFRLVSIFVENIKSLLWSSTQWKRIMAT